MKWDIQNTCGIYQIYNKTNGRKYVGKSRAIGFRLGTHISQLITNAHYNADLQADYGDGGDLSQFEFSVLEVCPEDISDAELNDKERQHILNVPEDIRYNVAIPNVMTANLNAFLEYINNKWLVPRGSSSEEAERYRIWREEDKQEIILKAIQCRVFSCAKRDITFLRIIRTLETLCGYTIKGGRFHTSVNRSSYKLIMQK